MVKSTPISRPGQGPTARTIKAIVRPILKALYYTIQWIRRHGAVSLIAFVLLIVSIFATSYYSTGEFPFHIGQDQFNFNIHGTDGGGLSVKNWLYSLRDGDTSTLTLLDKDMNPQPSQQTLQGYISQFSQSQSHLQWSSITVLRAYEEPDTSVDSFVEVSLSASGPGGTTKGYLIIHFVSVSANGQELLLEATPITFRAPLQ